MKDSELLKLARARIESRDSVFICWALDSVGNSLRKKHKRTDLIKIDRRIFDLKRWVYKMLNPSSSSSAYVSSLRDWLVVLREIEVDVNNPEHITKLRNTRLAWLDWMIEQCEKGRAR